MKSYHRIGSRILAYSLIVFRTRLLYCKLTIANFKLQIEQADQLTLNLERTRSILNLQFAIYDLQSLQLNGHFGVHSRAEQPLPVYFAIVDQCPDEVLAVGLDHGIDEDDVACKGFVASPGEHDADGDGPPDDFLGGELGDFQSSLDPQLVDLHEVQNRFATLRPFACVAVDFLNLSGQGGFNAAVFDLFSGLGQFGVADFANPAT